jgi:hypothetical protein
VFQPVGAGNEVRKAWFAVPGIPIKRSGVLYLAMGVLQFAVVFVLVIVGVVAVIVFMLVVHGRWRIVHLRRGRGIRGRLQDGCVFSRLRVQRGGGFKVLALRGEFLVPEIHTARGCVIFQRGGCSGVDGPQEAACAPLRRPQA